MQHIQLGVDRFLQQAEKYSHQRLALVTNNVAATSEGIKTRMALLHNGFGLKKLFSPEHGLTALGKDGAFQHHSTDSLTGLPVISLYGDRIAPAEADLEDVDAVIVDLPDVGCRFYTYLWTMTYVMERCAACNKRVIILDRPNPISGNMLSAEGPMLDEAACASFIGRWSIPIRHSCTIGELANYFASTRMPQLCLEIIQLKNWERNQMMDDLHFVPTSPAIKNITTALLYPGMGLLEGINVNEGRGTEKPFRIFGAPWIKGITLQKAFEGKGYEGMIARSCAYTPKEGMYAGEPCEGLEFFITHTASFRPVAMGVALLQTLFSLYSLEVKERLYKTRANPSGIAHLDKLLGVENAMAKIKNGEAPATDVSVEWRRIIEPFLLY